MGKRQYIYYYIICLILALMAKFTYYPFKKGSHLNFMKTQIVWIKYLQLTDNEVVQNFSFFEDVVKVDFADF